MGECECEYGCTKSPPPEFDDFVKAIRFDELCTAATNLRGGISCELGKHIIGGFNVVYELLFSDNVVWMARIPLPYSCYQPEVLSLLGLP